MLWKKILALCLRALHVFPLFGHCEVAVAPWQWTGISMEQHHVSPPGSVSCGQVLQWFWWFHSCGCLEMSDTRSSWGGRGACQPSCCAGREGGLLAGAEFQCCWGRARSALRSRAGLCRGLSTGLWVWRVPTFPKGTRKKLIWCVPLGAVGLAGPCLLSWGQGVN